MNLKQINKIAEVLNGNDCYLYDQNGVFMPTSSILHLAIIHNSNPSLYTLVKDIKPKKGKRKSSKKIDNELELELDENTTKFELSSEEDPLTFGEETVSVNEDDVYRIIAKKLKISEPSLSILKDNGWYAIPIFDNMDNGLRPLNVEDIKNGFKLTLCDKIVENCSQEDFDAVADKINWKHSSWPVLDKVFESTNGRLSVKAIFHNKRERNRLTADIKLAEQMFVVVQKNRIKLSNTFVNYIFRRSSKEEFYRDKASKIKVDTSKDTMDKIKPEDLDQVKIIDYIVKEYKLIKKKVTELVYYPNRENFHQYIDGDENVGKYVDSYDMYKNVEVYMLLTAAEESARIHLEELVEQHPLWNRYLCNIKGCGKLSAAYIISALDPTVAEHPSSFMKYTGLDQVPVKPDENQQSITPDEIVKIIRLLFRDIDLINMRVNSNNEEEVNKYNWKTYKTDSIIKFEEYETVYQVYKEFEGCASDAATHINEKQYPEFVKLIKTIYSEFVVYNATNYKGDEVSVIKKRARSKAKDKVITTYLSKDGKIKTKYSLGYNAAFKGKMLGVLFTCFLRVRGESYYKDVYKDYRERLENRPDIKEAIAEGKKPFIHAMARRYTMQRFIEDLWINWRTIEGLPLNGGTYARAKLGIFHKNGRVAPSLLSPEEVEQIKVSRKKKASKFDIIIDEAEKAKSLHPIEEDESFNEDQIDNQEDVIEVKEEKKEEPKSTPKRRRGRPRKNVIIDDQNSLF